jgi:WD40 repeat protein
MPGPTRSILLAALFCGLLVACSEQKQALDTWVHADTGSYGAAISPDGKHLLTGEIGGFARVWDLQTNQVKYSLQHEEGAEGGVIDADFSEHGEVLVTIEQNSIARWVVASGRLTGYWAWPGLTDVAVSADGRHALIGSKDRQAVYFDMVDGKMRYVFPHHHKVTSVALSKDGRFALTGSDDWHASLWDLATGEHLWSKNMKYKISLVALSDDGELALAGAYIGDAHIYATRGEGSLVSRLDEVKMTLVSADFSDDNRTLATGRAAKAIDIWDVASGKRRETWKPRVKHRVQPDSATILDLKLDANARTLISESSAGIGQRWAVN